MGSGLSRPAAGLAIGSGARSHRCQPRQPGRPRFHRPATLAWTRGLAAGSRSRADLHPAVGAQRVPAPLPPQVLSSHRDWWALAIVSARRWSARFVALTRPIAWVLE